MAVALAKGDSIATVATAKVDSPTTKQVPSLLIPVVSLTKANVKDTVIRDNVYSADEICTDKYAAACAAIGLK